MADLNNMRDLYQFAEGVAHSGSTRKAFDSMADGLTETAKASKRENIKAEVQAAAEIEAFPTDGWSEAGLAVKAKALEKLSKM